MKNTFAQLFPPLFFGWPLLLLVGAVAQAGPPPTPSPEELALDKLIEAGLAQNEIPESLDAVGVAMLGTTYKLGVSGEGALDVFDQDPLWRLDALDCTTYIETVMAVAFASDRETFLRALFRIRYRDGVVAYGSRNHFPEADWIVNNAKEGFVRDRTQELFPELARSVSVTIDKAKWYAAKTANDVEPKERPEAERERLAAELRARAVEFQPEPVTVPYLPMQSFFVKNPVNGELDPNTGVLKRIPHGAIFNIVREGWAPGGHSLAISHQGFVLQKAEGTFMRHAATNKQVMEDRIDLYFKRFLESPTVRGINILEVLDPGPAFKPRGK